MSEEKNRETIYRLVKQSEELAQTFYRLSEESYTFGSPWTLEQFEGTFKQPHLFYIVAELKNEIVGFLGASMVHNQAEIYNIVVSDAYKRRGIGSGLIREMKRIMKANGAFELFLEVRISNKPAILLYKYLDFQPVGVRPNYYSKPKEDAVVLKCDIRKEELE